VHITILTVGTRGDVQPFVALGKALNAAGHDVTLSTGMGFSSLVECEGLNYFPIRVNYRELVDSAEGREILNNPLSAVKYLFSTFFPMTRTLLEDAWLAARDADAIVFHPKVLGGADITEKLGVPALVAHPLPTVSPTAAFPAPAVTATDLGAWGNRATYAGVRYGTLPFLHVVNRWRRETLNLPKRSLFRDPFAIDGEPLPVLYGVSPHVVPPPNDWPATTHVTGYWFLERVEAWTPPENLVDFIEAGPSPIYVGFGSMVGRAPEQLTSIVRTALQRTGRRAVLATGWGGLQLGATSDELYVVESVPHDWLFPQMDVVVHHGGAGTTAAGLRAGTPTVVCPFFGDQPFWGERVHALGAGPKPVPSEDLTADTLARAIEQARDSEIVAQAGCIGEKIRAEDGVGRAVDLIHQYCGNE